MSKQTLHLQEIPGWLNEFYEACQGKLGYIKGVNVYPKLAGVRTLGRPMVDNARSDALVMQGAAGADAYIAEIAPVLRDNPHVYAWQMANEFIVDTQRKADLFNGFWLRAIERMSALGYRVMAGNINTGWPRLRRFQDPPPYPDAFRPMLDALIAHDGLFSFHEYSWGHLSDRAGELCLRYRHTLEEAGQPLPRVVIGELGLDSVTAGRFPHKGWQDLGLSPAAYLEQLAWYDGELSRDPAVEAACIFTVCSWDWHTFGVTRELAMKLAAHVAAGAAPVADPLPQPAPASRIGRPPMVELVDELVDNPAVAPYPERELTEIHRLVIHHSASSPRTTPQSIHRYHVNRGWARIAYHAVIAEDGTIYRTNLLRTVSNHAYRQNTHTAGICLAGNFQQAPPPEAQLRAAAQLVAWWRFVLSLPEAAVVGHKDLPGQATACPGNTWPEWRACLLAV